MAIPAENLYAYYSGLQQQLVCIATEVLRSLQAMLDIA
jgi:hypothetical protein